MEFRADAAIDYVGQGSTIVHAHVIFVLEALDLGPRHTIRHSLMCYIHLVVNSWDGLRCVAHGERVHFRTQANELDDRISFGFVFEVANISGVEISITTSEVRKVPITYLAEIESVSKVRAQVNFFGQVIHEEMKKERVGVRVQHSDFLSEDVFELRVKGVPIEIYTSFNSTQVKTKLIGSHTFLACYIPARKSHLRTAC